MHQTDLSDLSATVIPMRKNVVDTFAKATNLFYARHENGSIYVSNGYYMLKTNQTGFDYLTEQVNKRKRASDIAVTENKRILDYVKKAKGTFELTQKPHELELHKGCTACFYADEKQYFGYNKKFVGILKNLDNRLFVDDNAGYDVYSHSLIAKGHNNEILGIALPLTVTDGMYEKLTDVLPLKVKRKSDIERIKENPTNDPYIGKEFSDGRNNYIISAVRNYGDVDMYVVPKIENGKVSKSADLVKVDEIEKQVARWEANNQKVVKEIVDKKIITYIEVLKRTFEGNIDPAKNNDVLTSKYSPSKKYLLRYKYAGSNNDINESYETKSLAELAKAQMLKFNIDGRQNMAEQIIEIPAIKKPAMAEQMANAAKQAVKYNADRQTAPVPVKNKKAQSAEL